MAEKKKDEAAEAPESDGSAQAVQNLVDEETKRGYRGTEVDPTPNENYTLEGVTSDAPTPETDEDAAEAARAAAAELGKRV